MNVHISIYLAHTNWKYERAARSQLRGLGVVAGKNGVVWSVWSNLEKKEKASAC